MSSELTDLSVLPRPFPNSYWVEADRLLAGEYPGVATRKQSVRRLQALFAAGIRIFIDLTGLDELPDYDVLLDELPTGDAIEHLRFSIRDHAVPAEPQTIVAALDAIDAALAAGRGVYVHCRAGIGRTGMVIACYLIRRGRAPNDALNWLNQLWLQSERSHAWPSTPETLEQVDYVLKWREPTQGAAALTLSERYEGAIVGLAMGDAIGTALQRGVLEVRALQAALASEAAIVLPKLEWGADTAATMCLAESLLATQRNDANDQLGRYLEWQRGVTLSHVKELPAELRRAVSTWAWSRKPLGGSHDPNNRDPHTVARTVAVTLYYFDSPTRALEEAAEASRPTLQSPVVLDVCRAYAALLLGALSAAERDALLSIQVAPIAAAWNARPAKPDVLRAVQRAPSRKSRHTDALGVLSAAIFGMQRESFADGLFDVAQPPTSPSALAVYGALAGAFYGASAIPVAWRNALSHSQELISMAQHLFKQRATQ